MALAFEKSTVSCIGAYNGTQKKTKPVCSTGTISKSNQLLSLWRGTELQNERSKSFSRQARQTLGLRAQFESQSQRNPEITSSAAARGKGDGILSSTEAAYTIDPLDVSMDISKLVGENSPTSTLAPETISPSKKGASATVNEHFKSEKATFLSIAIVGATGELATGKIFPALFALYYSGAIPEKFAIFGYSRSDLTDDQLRELISKRLPCRIDDQENCGEKMGTFLQKVFYLPGGYEGCDKLKDLNGRMKRLEGDEVANRLFYLAIPQDVLLEVAACLSKSLQSERGWTRVIVEKPFGRTSELSAKFSKSLSTGLREEQIFRIDHLLGKEVIENLTVLRFSNLVFEPLWSRKYIKNVQFIHSENWGVPEGRGRYYEDYGVVRDLIQSHILQTIALFAMEPPVSLEGEDIRNEKVKVLRSMCTPTFPDDVAIGQYKASLSKDGRPRRGYLDEPDVRSMSLTPTFVSMALYINNARWDGVPFFIRAGNGLNKHSEEIRIQFRHVPGNLYRELLGYNLNAATNELILRIQPDEGLYLKINNKVPGLSTQLDTTELNLLYHDKYEADVPDSFERLILDVINGMNHLFIRGDELAESWNILSPLLDEIESRRVVPELYPFGGRGPINAYYLSAKHGVTWAGE